MGATAKNKASFPGWGSWLYILRLQKCLILIG